MTQEYEINDLAKEESWRMFRVIGELVEGFDKLSGIEPAVTIYGSARLKAEDELYLQIEEIANRLGQMGFTIITGGGPGVMEAANKGAIKAGVTSVGLNINLPEAQDSNPYTTKSITFNHFFVRKVMLVKYATAFIIMPGGLGTLDELTEVLALIQTQFNGQYWQGLLDWLKSCIFARGFISENDLDLLRICDHPDEVIEAVHRWYIKHEIFGRKALTE